jgi:signal transduction histidine kinase/CheY-like chemotaxis protein/HPt (histidine-containing phosphotransfer) domain-containing protein/HAMP domain-containing protein
MMRITLKTRVFTLVSALVLCSMLASSYFLLRDVTDLLDENFRARGSVIANYFARNSVGGILIEDEDSLTRTIKRLFEIRGIVYAGIYNAEGTQLAAQSTVPLADNRILRAGRPPSSLEITPALAGQDHSLPVLYFKAPVVDEDGKKIGSVHVGISLEGIRVQVRRMAVRAAALLAAFIGISFVATFVVAKSIVHPIKALTRVFGLIAGGDLDQPIDTRRQDELGSLAVNFAALRDSVRQKIQLLQAEVAVRTRTEEELARHRDHLEEIVNERTTELSTANERLTQEVAQRQQSARLIDGLNQLKEDLLRSASLEDKLRRITEATQTLFQADFVRIWLVRPGDLCESGCVHAEVMEGPHVCRHRDQCLHLVTSSGRYTHLDGKVHRRVPFGCYKIGRVASGEMPRFVTNDVVHDERVHDRQWAAELGLVSFAGFRLLSDERTSMGVLALFSQHPLSTKEAALLEGVAGTTAQVIQTARAEEALRKAKDEAEAASRTKSAFLANMSHEIRTPMNAIIGFSDMLTDGPLSGDQRRHIEIIRDSSRSLLSLVNDILDFSKIEAGKMNIEKVDCSLGHILSSLQAITLPRARDKGVELRIVEKSVLPATLHTDPVRLSQCLLNLVSNAVKFTDQGHVHVNVSLETPYDRPSIRFDVEDTGIGIPKEKQELIFESFSQADRSTTRKYGGTGLGLTITKQLTELLGGQLTVTSEQGRGAVFSLAIPVGLDVTQQPLLDRGRTPDHEAAKAGATPATFSGRVLVAEDVEANQVLMTSLLTRMGLEVTVAQDGNQAVDKVLSETFDLVLMDIQMPNLNGYEATQAIRRQGRTVPIVALTANAMKGDDQQCMDAGCDAYLTKPVDRAELQNTLARYLQPGKECPAPASASRPAESATSCAGPAAVHPSGGSQASGPRLRQIINWDRLMDRLGDEAIIREVIPTYIESARERLAAMTDALRSADCQAVASHAHALKGVARNLSLERLSNAAGQMESAARNQDIETATLSLNEVTTQVNEVLSMLSQPDWIEAAKEGTSPQLSAVSSQPKA